jgi:L-threonylcarbamoyladenylate synthase
VPVLLRPGGVTIERIESLLGVSVSRTPRAEARAPGMLASHYAPRARVEIAKSARELVERARTLAERGERVAVLVTPADDSQALSSLERVSVLDLGPDEESAARALYGALRQADENGADVVLASPVHERGLGEALADRLTKAAGPR